MTTYSSRSDKAIFNFLSFYGTALFISFKSYGKDVRGQ